MTREQCLQSAASPDHAGRVLVLEAPCGRSRRALLGEIPARLESAKGQAWSVSCDFHEGGLWAGINDVFRSMSSAFLARRPDLVQKHDYELVHVLPELRRSIVVRNPTLTDTASFHEKVRNYPADRAFRIVQGLIDFLDEWKASSASGERWVLACDGFDAISHIGRRFFRELMRRRGAALQMTLVIAVEPGQGESAAAHFRPSLLGPRYRLDLPREESRRLDPEEAARRALELEARLGSDRIEIERHLPELIRLWEQAGNAEMLLRPRLWGLELYNTTGFYEDALVYGEGALAAIRRHPFGDPKEMEWSVFIKLFMSLVGLRRSAEADALITGEMVGRDLDAEKRAKLCYLLAMLHARYFPERDLARGEEYLEEGLRHLAQSSLTGGEREFQYVFNRNGLAMIRTFQRRFDEALETCLAGFVHLEKHLGDDRYRLHRSVLLYNMAQVYTAIGSYDQAIVHYSRAIEMDPNYSEYYNERGSAHLKLGDLAAALADYQVAIELSPPYHEVFMNLGHCCRLMGRWRDAVAAYDRSLDLEPDQSEALLVRAQALEALGEVERAFEDYCEVLRLQPDDWRASASRAVLHYEAGRHAESRADLDRAIGLVPGCAELYRNRGVVLTDLGEMERALDDFTNYLEMEPQAEDREEIEQRIGHLIGECRAAS